MKFGRVKQLYNKVDPGDDTAVQRLRAEAENFLKATGANQSVEVWMIAPNQAVAGLTPIEAVRYGRYRSDLFDTLRQSAVKKDAVKKDAKVMPLRAAS
jgi:hypothetical protein